MIYLIFKIKKIYFSKKKCAKKMKFLLLKKNSNLSKKKLISTIYPYINSSNFLNLITKNDLSNPQ